jgi:large subunit ribosomal protein L20
LPRVSRSVTSHRRHRKLLKRAGGYWGARSRTVKAAKETLMRAGQFAYRDRRTRKREFRRLWIVRINAAARLHGLSYSVFMRGLKQARVELDRKVLADIAIHDPAGFKELVSLAASQVSGQAG